MLARYLGYIVAWLVARFGEEVLEWSLRQAVDYFRDHPEQGKQAATWAAPRCLADHDPDDDCYFWEKN